MTLPDIFSRRSLMELQKSDIYIYDQVPEKLSIQLIYVATDLFGNGSKYSTDKYSNFSSAGAWKNLQDFLFREWGTIYEGRKSPRDLLIHYLTYNSLTISQFLDFCDAIFILSNRNSKFSFQKKTREQSIEELNNRFLEANFGYQYDGEKIIRIDNILIHREVVQPVLMFLSAPLFSKADSDYRLAHEHYREHKIKDCIIACGRAFESTMKAICDDKQWPYNNGARATDLITTLRENGLFQDGADKSFNTYVAMLKTGVPDLRNAVGGHGEASDALPPPMFMASYALHMTATNILFLAEAWKASR